MKKLSVWRKSLIVISCILIVFIAVITGILSEETLDSYIWRHYDRQAALMTRFLFKVGIGLSLVVFYASSWALGNLNRTAKILCRIINFYFVLLIVVAFLATRLYPEVDITVQSFVFYPYYLGFLGTVLLYSILNSYLSKKSNIEKSPYCFFPNWLIKLYGLKSHLAKRVFGLFILYPFYYLVPIPVAGVFIFLLYILPLSFVVLLLSLLLSGFVRIARWVIEGWKMDRGDIS